jgi:putative ABC transport system ATP-binding protein
MPASRVQATPVSPSAVEEDGVAARATALAKTYGRGATTVHALDGVDLEVARGRFTAIMGPSGSGKSTLMHCLAGLDTPSSGSVVVAGRELAALDDTALTRFRRDHVGFVFQSFNLLPMLTAKANILLPVDLASARVDPAWFDLLVDVLGLHDRLDHRPSELSGGQQQRVAVARGLIARPTIMFADEPTGNLDSRSSAEVLGLLRRCVRELGQTVVMVTHDLASAAYADDLVEIEDGRVVSSGPVPR